MQPVYHPTRVGRQIGPGGAERDAFRRFHQAVHPAFGRDSRHCRLCAGGSVREIGRSLPVVARQPPSGRGEGGGVCCFDSRNRQFARFDDEQYLHDLYDGYLPFLFPERGRTERAGPYRTLGELRLAADSRADRPDAVGVGPGVPVYPGVYRLCQSRRPVDLPGRLLL